MSWTKRGQAAAAPGDQPYAAAPQIQPITNQQNMYPKYEGGASNTGHSQQQQYWQPQQPPQYSHQPQHSQPYSQDYPPNANQYQPDQNHYNQNYTNQGYATQQDYHHNYYQNQPMQQNSVQNVTQNTANTGNADGWDENWDWGWEENAKKVQSTQNVTKVQPAPHQVFNNANVIEESFASTDSWNWGTDDKKQGPALRTVPPQQEKNEPASLPTHVANIVAPQSVHKNFNQQTQQQQQQEVKTLNDREVVKERLPNLALGKRFHLENLTPQWSIESQMSQDSSDGPHTQSEGTCRSENQSRNSGESPGSNLDNSNFNYVQSGFNETYTQNSEWPKNSEEPTVAYTNNVSRRESQDEISNSLQQMNIFNDHSGSKQLQPINSSDVLDNISSQPLPATTSMSFPSPVTGSAPAKVASIPPPPPACPAHLPPPVTGAALPRPSSTSSVPGPSQAGLLQPPHASLPPPPNSQNPFQRAGPYSHKSAGNSVQPQAPVDLTSPAAVNKVSQNRLAVGFEANLETTPDNSERPDQLQGPFLQPQVPRSVPDNLEVAPQNDRNEYLQTAHLSSADYGQNTDFVRSEPPPGLRRMVVGRRESDYRNVMVAGDEPPPGLSRMVPGQQNEGDGACVQRGDEYPERRGDGQRCGRPDLYPQGALAFGRMVPGEPSRDDYSQYQGPTYAIGEPRVVTGLERAADYSEPLPPAAEPSCASTPAPDPAPAPAQRELTVEGENLQDLSVVSSAELTYSREHLDGADRNATDAGTDGNEASDSAERPAAGARKLSQSRGRARSSGDDTDRLDATPRRERHKASRDRERNRDREKEGRYSRGNYDRDDRRPDRDRRDRDRGERRREEASPEARRGDRTRRSTRSRKHDEDDAHYYSDRGKDPRRHREGSYTSKPPRAGDRDRDRDRDRPVRRDRDRDHERYYSNYREIDPSRKFGNLHHEREEARRRGDTYSSASRPDSREAAATDEDVEARRSQARRRPRHHRPDPYYDAYGAYQDPYALQRQQYSYYEQLRVTDPAAYMQVYQQLMAGRAPPVPLPPTGPRDLSHHRQYLATEGFVSLGSEGVERGSVHSGRSSARGGPDTELATDASLGLQLDASTVRSDRMTPHRFSTAHVKGSIGSRDIVVVPASYPVDGRPATVQLVSLSAARAADPAAAELLHSPAPLLKGVTHKKSVIEYCMVRVRNAAREGALDLTGYILVWELLALMLRQNGVVVGTDIAELLMKNTKEHPLRRWSESSASGSLREEGREDSSPPLCEAADGRQSPGCADERAALDKYREYLLYGNRQEALEWAMCNKLWGHALQLAASGERRVRATVCARFVASVPRADPLHTLYATLAHAAPPHAATAPCIVDDKWREWRTHGAMLLANSAARPDHSARALIALGDSLMSRGLPYCAQFCFVSAGVPFGRHPLAPLWPPSTTPSPSPATPAPAPRLTLLLAAPHAASLPQLATTRAILATEIYEWARSLSGDYVLDELQVYKVVAACRLVDAGQYERALHYVEAAARAVTRPAAPAPPPRLLAALAELADRLKYHDPLLSGAGTGEGEGGEGSGEGSPRHHQWRDDIVNMAHSLQMQSPQPSPLHCQTTAHAWTDQTQQYQESPSQALVEQEESAECPQYYQPPPAPEHSQPPAQYEQLAAPEYQYPEWGRTEETHSQTYGDYWQGDSAYTYGQSGDTESPRPAISMPAARRYDEGASSAEQADRSADSPPPPPPPTKGKEGKDGSKGASWIGGILTKLSLRPPNQMILPDDKNPTIVWDAAEKRWRNTSGGEEEVDRPPPPPPSVSDLRLPSSSPPPQGTPGAPVSNIFKMQKSRHIKKSYVDVFNPGGATSRPLPAAGDVLGPPPPAPAPAPPLAPHNYLVPAPLAKVTLQKNVHVMIPLSLPPTPEPCPSPSPSPGADEDNVYSGDQYPHSGI